MVAVIVDVEDSGPAKVALELDSCNIVSTWDVDVLPTLRVEGVANPDH